MFDVSLTAAADQHSWHVALVDLVVVHIHTLGAITSNSGKQVSLFYYILLVVG